MTLFTGLDDGDIFEQLNHTIAKYEARNRHPSVHPAGSSTIIGVVGLLQVNKELPPLPSEDGPLSSEDKILGRYPSFYPLHQFRSRATKTGSRPSTNTYLSINPPPSLGSRTSAYSGVDTRSSILNSDFGTSASTDSRPSSAFTASRYYSPSVGQAAQLLAEPEEPRWSVPETELVDLSSPSSSMLQIAPHNHVPLEEHSPIEHTSSLQNSHLFGWDSGYLSSGKTFAVEKHLNPRGALFGFEGEYDSSGSEASPVIGWKPLIPTLSPISSSESDPRHPRPVPSQFRVHTPPPPKYSPRSTARKRKKTGVHSYPVSPSRILFTPELGDYSNKRRSRDHHHLPRASSCSSDEETSSSLHSQSACNSSTVSAPSPAVEWVYPLWLTLEELFKGGTYTYQITTRLLSGESKIQAVGINVMPGWSSGTRIIIPNAGNECTPGVFQTMVFVVNQVEHGRFTRRERGKLVYDQNISHLDARKANGTRAPCRVVGLDGKVIEFYPPRGEIWHGRKTVIKGEGMHKRSNGTVVGRGDLIIRWNITP